MKNKIYFTFISLLVVGISLYGCSGAKESQEAIVETTAGTLSGEIEDSIFIFKGIPYAKAERFMPPQDPDSWEGVLECTEFSPVARQIVAWIPDSTQNEKELFTVNVWTQGINDGNNAL